MKLLRIFAILFFFASFFGCGEVTETRHDQLLKERGAAATEFKNTLMYQDHVLRKMFSVSEQSEKSNGKISGSYFLFTGSLEGDLISEKNTVPQIYFAWYDLRTGSYIISSVSIKKARLDIEKDVSIPSVRFDIDQKKYYDDVCKEVLSPQEEKDKRLLHPHERFDAETQNFFDTYVSSVTIKCSEKDWPEDIHLPMN